MNVERLIRTWLIFFVGFRSSYESWKWLEKQISVCLARESILKRISIFLSFVTCNVFLAILNISKLTYTYMTRHCVRDSKGTFMTCSVGSLILILYHEPKRKLTRTILIFYFPLETVGMRTGSVLQIPTLIRSFEPNDVLGEPFYLTCW